MTTYGDLRRTHPDHDAAWWSRIDALYRGGRAVVGSAVQPDLMPRHLGEEESVYRERLRRAHYIPIMGAIIDQIVAELFGARLDVSTDGLPDYYSDFLDDCSPPGGRRMPFIGLLREQALDAMLFGRAWCLVDLPSLAQDGIASLADQERSGALRAYAATVRPWSVLDWEEGQDGALEWAIMVDRSARRTGLDSARNTIEERFWLYDREGWELYTVEYPSDKAPMDTLEVAQSASGKHGAGMVPLVPLELPPGLCAGEKLAPLAIAHLNATNAVAWAEYRTLFPTLVHFLAKEDITDPMTEDPDRAVRQKWGPGRVVRLAAGDRVEYIQPDAAIFSAAQEDAARIRDEMYRVVHHMALAVEGASEALRRSAESKAIDHASTAIVLRALGERIVEHARRILDAVMALRGEDLEIRVSGMDSYGLESVDDHLKRAEAVELIRIPSPTFKAIYRARLAREILGEDATPEDMARIREELAASALEEGFYEAEGGGAGGEPGGEAIQ